MGRDPELYGVLEDLGIASKIEISREELAEVIKIPADELPDDIYYTIPYNVKDKPENRTYFRYKKPPEQEMMFRLAVVNAKNINTIKRCAVFLAVFTVVAFVIFLYITSNI